MKKKLKKVAKTSAKIILYKILILLILFITLALITNVNVRNTKEDDFIFKTQFNFEDLKTDRFENQIEAIRYIQHRVFELAPMGEGIPIYNSREPKDLVQKREGLCFDRSRTIDKAAEYINLPSRHVYLLYRGNSSSFLNALFHYGQSSHAVTEVKTSKGWMMVDSNSQWIALTRDGQVVNADDVWKRAAEFDNIPEYLKEPWWAIRGMYSRKGQLYPPYIMFPDFNWPEFFNWLIKG